MDPARLRRLARSERTAAHAGFWWGLAEGTAFFIVPDVYISFAALFSLRAGAVAWLSSIAGSVAAIVLIFLISGVLGLDFLGFLPAIPAISPSMIEEVAETLAASGLPYTPLLVLGGVPLKVYGGVACSLGMSLGPVIVWTVFARMVRIAPSYGLAAGARLLLGRHIDAHAKSWTTVLIGVWVAFYTFYFIAMGR